MQQLWVLVRGRVGAPGGSAHWHATNFLIESQTCVLRDAAGLIYQISVGLWSRSRLWRQPVLSQLCLLLLEHLTARLACHQLRIAVTSESSTAGYFPAQSSDNISAVA